MTKILVPTSGPPAAGETADYVMQIASSIEAEVFALHVLRNGHAKEAGELTLEFFSKAGEAAGIKVTCEFRKGAVVDQIIEFAEENRIDLIVMGASGGNVVDEWISSDVRQHTVIPVLVIPYHIFE